MVARAVVAGAIAAPAAFGAGFAAGDLDGGLSAALGVAVVVANFAAQGLSLAWASRVSLVVVQVVALGGFVVRMGVIFGILLILDRTAFFSPLIFGLAAVASVLSLLGYEVRLVKRGLGGGLEIPPSPVMVRAAERLAQREAR